ncbi:protein stoned-B-like [Galleria mellonella]|uniref:Protein stoned-B-like n=1 Tax=Galleria mellonella TaxID=7137 RepID=A0A6J3C4W5_GALME|nr:protein stoned-B-like [Galleria mellonella]
MLKLPKGLKKKKKGKKSKRKGEEELFTEEELEKYRREHQQQQTETGEGSAKENEEWSKFKDLTTGVDSVLKKTQGDLDRIKSTSFFQRVAPKAQEVKPEPKPTSHRPVVEVTAADFPQLVQAAAAAEVDSGDKSDYGVTDDESEEEDQDDIFDTSYVEAVERGEVKLAYVPDSPEEFQDDDIFDTSHVDALIKGQEAKSSKGKKALDIGIAVEVLTGRIDNVTVTTRRSKRTISGDLLLENTETDRPIVSTTNNTEPVEKSILDTDADVPITTPIDLSVSLHTSLILQNKVNTQEEPTFDNTENKQDICEEEEVDEFTLLAAESLESNTEATKLQEKEIKLEPVLQESWSAFEADKNDAVFAESIVEDQIDVIDPYLDQDDPFDTSFADVVVSSALTKKEAVILEDDDDFDPRADEIPARLNNRRKSSVRIHLTNPSGIRESITSDDIIDKENSRDLLGGSTTDLTQLGDSPLDPVDINSTEIDPFDTTIVDNIVAPGKIELKLLEQELIESQPSQIYRVPSDPDFDPRAEEPKKEERRASRPENLVVSKSVVFNIETVEAFDLDSKGKIVKPLTPYYTRDHSITEDISEEAEAVDIVTDNLTRTRSDEDLAPKSNYQTKRRHSEYPQTSNIKSNSKSSDIFYSTHNEIKAKVLTPSDPQQSANKIETDPFDTSFAGDIAPSKTELKLLAKEFSCENTDNIQIEGSDLLEPSDDIFQVKALSPEPTAPTNLPEEDFDPFDTSFASDLNPGKTELNMNEPAAPVSTDAILNPFMMTDTEPNTFSNDNPFAASNPFSDFGNNYEPPAGDTVPADIFGITDPTSIGAKQCNDFTAETTTFDVFSAHSSVSERLTKPTELELTSTTVDLTYPIEDETFTQQRPLPPETQNLILSVTGQMEFTSSHLLDRIPPTRTPSPVSVRDIHSPSPTPEPEAEPEPVTDSFDINRNKPARPPPARPPPVARPPPPRPAPPPVPQVQPSQQPQPKPTQPALDDINLFDAPAPVAVKPTKEDILSLYSAPKKEQQPIDFLSDDILDSAPNESIMEIQQPVTSMDANDFMSVKDTVAPIVSEVKSAETNLSTPVNVIADADAAMDCTEPAPDMSSTAVVNSPFTNILDDAMQTRRSSGAEKNPFEISGNIDSHMFEETQGGIFNVQTDDSTINNTVVETTQSNAFDSVPNENVEVTHSDVFSSTKDTFGNNDFTNVTDSFMETQTLQSNDPGWGDTSEAMVQDAFPESQDAFDAFSAKFDSTSANHKNTGAWGDEGSSEGIPSGFEAEAFDPFLSMDAPPPPAATPRLDHQGSRDSTDDTFSVFIRPKDNDTSGEEAAVPVLAPPPRPQALPESPRFNPFDKSGFESQQVPADAQNQVADDERRRSTSGGETPPTPLFDEDVSMPLEDFPRTTYKGPGWEMHLRQPNKKKITGQRFWKKVFVRMTYQGDNPVVQLFNAAGDKEPFQELPLQACYSVSEVGAQQFDQFGKIFTVKLQYVFYKERPGVRPGQVTKAERITNKLSQFAAYAIQGDYQGVKEFGSDLRKLGLPVEHAPQVSQLFKLGSLNYEDVKQFSCCIEEALFRLPAHRDRALTYKMEEVQITAVDELYVEQDAEGSVLKQIARVRLFFLGFLSGMPDVELGVNDLRRQGKEVVGRHDIIPVVTEEWIRVEDAQFHACVQPEEFDNTQIIKFKPPDACYIELMRFRVRPPKNRELPLQLKAVWCVTGNKVELRADVLVPGFASRKLGQVPCEDVSIRFPIPECWIYLFRVEKHFRYGSVKSAHRRTGKIKGIERFLGAVDTLQESLIEVTSGQAKYEHQHRAIVWRMPRLPKEGQGAYTTHNLVCRMALTSYDQVPSELARHAFVEFTMPATQVSHMTVRSVSLQNHDNDPPEKYVRYLARHEYIVGIERTSGQAAPAYAVAAASDARPCAPAAPAAAPAAPQPPSSDSDSD